MELEDLSVFCFQVPYTFKQEAGLLRVEIGTGGRRNKKIERHIRKMRKRKRDEQTKPVEPESICDEEGILVEDQGEALNEVPTINDVVVADVRAESPPKSSAGEEEQECVLEVDLRCHCTRQTVNDGAAELESGSELFDTSAGEVIIIDDDDDEEQ